MALMPVVAGVDGSEESLRAVEWAALEAQRHRAPLRIVSVPALLPRTRAMQARRDRSRPGFAHPVRPEA
jgi:nucleotide-binding universal stress UspA family protein